MCGVDRVMRSLLSRIYAEEDGEVVMMMILTTWDKGEGMSQLKPNPMKS